MKYLRFFVFIFLFTGLNPDLYSQTPPDSVTVVEKDSIEQAERTQQLLEQMLEEAKKAAEAQESDPTVDLEIDELIVNEMRTKPGNDFFDLFSSKWTWPDTEGDFILVISERPFRGNSTQLQIQLNDFMVLETFLQPRNSYLEELSDYAVSLTTQYILNYRDLVNQLESGDQSGTGIY